MTEGTEQALEYACSGVLFCMAVVILVWLHGAWMRQAQVMGNAPERVIMFEQKG